jgi:hypothetical protein
VPARGIAAIVAVAPSADERLREAAEAAMHAHRAIAPSGDATFPAREAVRVRPPRSTGTAPGDALRLEPGERRLVLHHRRRETGVYGEAPYVEEWKPLPPRLHDARQLAVTVAVDAVAVAAREVTAAEYAAFCAASGRPRPMSAPDDAPAVDVSLADARAYAAWCGARLPTEFEWQLAAGAPGFVRLEPAVWNWTESEHRDGVTRFVQLTGGSRHVSTGSDWYFDGGLREPGFIAKYLLQGFGLDASPSIGFRLAWDLP